jgi:hypothetical protein
MIPRSGSSHAAVDTISQVGYCPVRRQTSARRPRTAHVGHHWACWVPTVVALDHSVLSGGTALAVGRHRLQESTVTRRRAKMPWTSPGIKPR